MIVLSNASIKAYDIIDRKVSNGIRPDDSNGIPVTSINDVCRSAGIG